MKRLFLTIALLLTLTSCDVISKTRTYFIITSDTISISSEKSIEEMAYSLICNDAQRLVTYVHRTGGPLKYGQINMTQFLNLFDIKTQLGEKSLTIRITYVDSLTGREHVFECLTAPPIYGTESKTLTWKILPLSQGQKIPIGTFESGTILVTLMVDRDSYLFKR